MLEGIIFATVFVAFFILRIIGATIFFYYMLPDTTRCPCCDTPTIRVQSAGWNRLLPWFRTSWCHACGWDGLLRYTAGADDPVHPGAASLTAPSAGERRGAGRAGTSST